MTDFIIATDSSCDLPIQLVREMGVAIVPLTASVGERSFMDTLEWKTISSEKFYALLRSGEVAKTSAANMTAFEKVLEEYLAQGKDVLYIGFSSALSATFNAGALAAQELQTRYPGRTFCAIDSLCASMGQGMLVYLAAMEKKKGKSLTEICDFVLEKRLHICHWFTVDDLMFLKRGGRISGATAILGKTLNIKPVMHVDNLGRLVKVENTRGRRNALRSMAEHMKESAENSSRAFISHADCMEDAEMLAEMIKKDFPPVEILINSVGPVIGAHSGPGTLALFFEGTNR